MGKIGREKRKKVYNSALMDVYHKRVYNNIFEGTDKERYQRFWIQIFGRYSWCEFWYCGNEYHIEDFICKD